MLSLICKQRHKSSLYSLEKAFCIKPCLAKMECINNGPHEKLFSINKLSYYGRNINLIPIQLSRDARKPVFGSGFLSRSDTNGLNSQRSRLEA